MHYLTVMLGVLAIPLLVVGCRHGATVPEEDYERSDIKSDFSTPEGAILRLEDSYRAKDIEAAVACKDFRTEAQLMLEGLDNLAKDEIDDALIDKTAESLELAYRKEREERGFPDMTGIRSAFLKTEPYQENTVIVTEVCHYPDGCTSKQRILVGKTAQGWRVLNPLD